MSETLKYLSVPSSAPTDDDDASTSSNDDNDDTFKHADFAMLIVVAVVLAVTLCVALGYIVFLHSKIQAMSAAQMTESRKSPIHL